MPDAGAIQENDVDRLENRRNSRRAEPPVSPIYTRADAEASLALLAPRPYEDWFEPLAGVRARLRDAGHILGSAFIEMEIDAEPRPVRLTISGDLGPQEKALQPDPSTPDPCDVLLLETHLRRSGPAAWERRPASCLAGTRAERCPQCRRQRDRAGVCRRAYAGDPRRHRAAQARTRPGADSRVPGFTSGWSHDRSLPSPSARAGRQTGPASILGRRLSPYETVEQSKAIGRIHGGAIVLAGSGMCEAGRVKHHLKDHLWRSNSTVLFVGYQAPGTLGAVIRDGAPRVRIHGEEINVKARIRAIDAYSGHADRDELVDWARPALPDLGSALLVHGEPGAVEGLTDSLSMAGLERTRILAPELDQAFEIELRDGRWVAIPSKAAVTPPPRRRPGHGAA